jgi:hypothetical protein
MFLDSKVGNEFCPSRRGAHGICTCCEIFLIIILEINPFISWILILLLVFTERRKKEKERKQENLSIQSQFPVKITDP